MSKKNPITAKNTIHFGQWIKHKEDTTGKEYWEHSQTGNKTYTEPRSIKFRRNPRRQTVPPSASASSNTDDINNDNNNHQNGTSRPVITRRRTNSNNENKNDNDGNDNDNDNSLSPSPPAQDNDLFTISIYNQSKSLNNVQDKIKSIKKPKNKKKWFKRNKSAHNTRRNRRSQTADASTLTTLTSSISNNYSSFSPTGHLKTSTATYFVVDDNKSNKSNNKRKRNQRSNTIILPHNNQKKQPKLLLSLSNSNTNGASLKLNLLRQSSAYGITPNANFTEIYNKLIGYDVLDINKSCTSSKWIKCCILDMMSYRYAALSLSDLKQFKPPLNDQYSSLIYFRNIEYPDYKLDTNLKIANIINQNIYENETPYLRIRIPLYIVKDIFVNRNFSDISRRQSQSVKINKLLGTNSNNNKHMRNNDEIFNIELSKYDILNTTVKQFYHSLAKQVSNIKDDQKLETLFCNYSDNMMNIKQLSTLKELKSDVTDASVSGSTTDDDDDYMYLLNNIQYKWCNLVLKAAGLEEYIFYSNNSEDKICNYECVRYALSHQLDSDDNKCYLTLTYLDEFDNKITKLKSNYVEYEQYLNIWKKNIEKICFNKEFKTNYPWLDAINKQYREYPKINDNNGNKCFSNIDYKRINDSIYNWKKEYDICNNLNNIILLQQYKCLFEFTIHSMTNLYKLPRFNHDKYQSVTISFELQIGNLSYESDIFLTPPKISNKIKFAKTIYKSRDLYINTFPREIILSIIVFGIPHKQQIQDLYAPIFDARSKDNLPTWFPNDDNNQYQYNTDNNNNNQQQPNDNQKKLLFEQPIDVNELKFNDGLSNLRPSSNLKVNIPSIQSSSSASSSSSSLVTSPASRKQRYSYGNIQDFQRRVSLNNDDNHRNYKDVLYRSFKNCDALAYLRIPLIDELHKYKHGTLTFNLWDIESWTKSKHSPRDPYDNSLEWRFIKPTSFPPTSLSSNSNQCQIVLTIGPNPNNNPHYKPPTAIAPLFNPIKPSKNDINSFHGSHSNLNLLLQSPQLVIASQDKFTAQEYNEMNLIIKRDPLTPLTKKEKLLIWLARDKLCKTKPKALPIFLKCVDWRNEYYRYEAYKYLYKWKLYDLCEDSLELLGWDYPDNHIRHFVITQLLMKLSDVQLKSYLLQLVQIIRLETHNYSFISSFLIQRGLRCVYRIGHYLYWLLKSEISTSYTCYIRFSLILEDFLLHLFDYPSKLYIQDTIVSGLERISRIVRDGKKQKQPHDELKYRMANILKRLNKEFKKFESVSIPLNPKYKLLSFNISQCKYMSSAQAPLWLEFNNYDKYSDDNIAVLFKNGDDLRQDMLTLQVMSCMNNLWLVSGYDMRLRIYDVITTSSVSGFIEIVRNSRTFNDLSVKLGGGIVGGPKDETVHVKYINQTYCNNKPGYNYKLRIAAQDRYLRSVAGYCIASWIIGIGDRHSDNIMVHSCGDVFHIDFGHFLGNFKIKKFTMNIFPGIKYQKKFLRERSPFVFLPSMKYCIKYNFKLNKSDNNNNDNNINYIRFVNLCTTAIDAIRRKQRFFLNLFRLMIPSQMPELLKLNDIIYMRDQMILNISNKYIDNVKKHVIKELDDSVNDGVRIFDNIVHAYVHSK